MAHAARLYLRLSTLLLLAGSALVLVGWIPTRRLGGIEGLQAMLAGCGVCLLASLVGALPVIRSKPGHSAQNITTLMGSMLLRLASAALLTLIVASQGRFAIKPLLVWVGISYLAFLPVDTYFSLRATRATDD
ncbi:MAG: hypothetical protein O7A98_03805 [Acidobacteria bacterium]|nr:hypothetical protein [Acidobacteriota bacterium]